MTLRPRRPSELPIDLAMFDGSPDLMCVRDMQGRFVRVNRAWQDTLGLPVEEVVNTPLLPLIHPADVPSTILHMGEADRGRAVVNFVNRYRRRDGSYRYMEWRAQRLGELILGRACDITALRLRDHELELARQLLSGTLADIADQVSAPAADILDTVRSLNQTMLTPVQDALVRRIGRSVETLQGLVAQMVAREREAAWAVFPLTLDHRRSNPEPAIEVRSRPASPDDADPPSGDPAAPLHAWIIDAVAFADRQRLFHNSLRDLSSEMLGLLCIRLEQLGQFYHRRLQNQIVKSGLMSTGRAAALLARMQDIGFVDVTGDFQAGQIRPYRVLPAMRQVFAEQMTINLRSMAATDYRAALALEAIQHDAGRATALLAAYAGALLDEYGLAERAPGRLLNGALLIAQGQSIALAIGAAVIEKHGATGEGWIEISLTAYAKRFEVSRTHVHRVIRNLEPCGLQPDPASPSRLLVTGGFLAAIGDYHAVICNSLARVLQEFI